MTGLRKLPVFVFAHVNVKVNLSKPLPKVVELLRQSGEIINVEVDWAPSTCSHCKQLGHIVRNCPNTTQIWVPISKNQVSTGNDSSIHPQTEITKLQVPSSYPIPPEPLAISPLPTTNTISPTIQIPTSNVQPKLTNTVNSDSVTYFSPSANRFSILSDTLTSPTTHQIPSLSVTNAIPVCQDIITIPNNQIIPNPINSPNHTETSCPNTKPFTPSITFIPPKLPVEEALLSQGESPLLPYDS